MRMNLNSNSINNQTLNQKNKNYDTLNSIFQYQYGPLTVWIMKCLQDNYAFILQLSKTSNSTKSSYTWVIDPPESDPINHFLSKNQFTLDEIWMTHHHSDHIGGVKNLKSHFHSLVRGNTTFSDRLPPIDLPINDPSHWNVEGIEISILHLPGHTHDHIGYWIQVENHSLLFSGDVLFGLGCGRLFEGTYKQLLDSLEKISKLPQNTLIFCSHEYTESNLQFTLQQNITEPKFIQNIEKRKLKIKTERSLNLPTIPLSLEEEKRTNLFLLALEKENPLDELQKIREARNNF